MNRAKDAGSIPASLYKYEAELLESNNDKMGEVKLINSSQIRRKYGSYSREKSKLLLKQYVEQNANGFWSIKESVLEEYGIHRMKFDQIFDGPLPEFGASKARLKKQAAPVNGKKQKQPAAVNGKKQKQGTLTKFFKEKVDKEKQVGNKTDLLEQMRKREEEYKLMKQKRAEEKLAEKQKLKEENLKVSMILKDWNRPKEDLELEDHMVLPVPAPVKLKIPDEYVGNVLALLEFTASFDTILQSKSFFGSGLSLELVERALIEKEVRLLYSFIVVQSICS